MPPALKNAQDAIHLPEVQEMLRKLSEYNLAIFMPHMHHEHTGEFQTLPNANMQVESGLEVSFQPAEAIAGRGDRFLPVAWAWRVGGPAPLAVCEMISEEGPGDAAPFVKHKILRENRSLSNS